LPVSCRSNWFYRDDCVGEGADDELEKLEALPDCSLDGTVDGSFAVDSELVNGELSVFSSAEVRTP